MSRAAARRCCAALGMGVVLLCAGRAAGAGGGDQVRDAVMRARGDVTFVRQRVCAAAGTSRASCGTLQEALGALDETKVVGETASGAADVAHGFSDAVASLLDAENLITTETGKDTGVSADMLSGVNKALKKVQAAQGEVAAEDSGTAGVAATGTGSNPNTGAGSRKDVNLSREGEKAAHGVSILSVVAVCLNLAAVVFLACLVWAGPLSRRKAAGDGSSGDVDELRSAAAEAAGRYATLMEENRRYQDRLKQLAVENEGLRRLLDRTEGREGGRMAMIEREPDFGIAKGEAVDVASGDMAGGDVESSEPGLTKYGPGRAPIVLNTDSVQEAEDARREMVSAERRGGVETAAYDPLADYRKARTMGGSEEEARFKRRYAPVYSLACTNLAQRGIAGARLTFREDPRASFLAVTAGEGRTLLFPQFSKELAFTPGMMEGVFVYPEGAISELALTQAAEVEAAGEEWVLVRPGQFEHA